MPEFIPPVAPFHVLEKGILNEDGEGAVGAIKNGRDRVVLVGISHPDLTATRVIEIFDDRGARWR